jgi:hypothetical protein
LLSRKMPPKGKKAQAKEPTPTTEQNDPRTQATEPDLLGAIGRLITSLDRVADAQSSQSNNQSADHVNVYRAPWIINYFGPLGTNSLPQVVNTNEVDDHTDEPSQYIIPGELRTRDQGSQAPVTPRDDNPGSSGHRTQQRTTNHGITYEKVPGIHTKGSRGPFLFVPCNVPKQFHGRYNVGYDRQVTGVEGRWEWFSVGENSAEDWARTSYGSQDTPDPTPDQVHEQIGGHSDSSGLLVVWVPYDPQTGAFGHIQTGRDSSGERSEHDETEDLDGDEAVDNGASAGSVVPPTPTKSGSLSGPGWTYDTSKAPQQTGEQMFHSVAQAAAEDPDRPRPKREGKAPAAKGTQTSLSGKSALEHHDAVPISSRTANTDI